MPAIDSRHRKTIRGRSNESYGYVCITLQENLSGTWYDKAGSNCASIPPGGGSGKRVTARKACSSTKSTYWRSYVTVSTSGGKGYGSDSTYTPEQDIACRA